MVHFVSMEHVPIVFGSGEGRGKSKDESIVKCLTYAIIKLALVIIYLKIQDTFNFDETYRLRSSQKT
jgi:hypothetical protein